MSKKRRYDPRRYTSHTSARYDNLEDAVLAAGGIFNPLSIEQDREVGGGIVQDSDGKYYFTFTLGEPKTGQVDMVIRKPRSHKLVAIWHSHGAPGPSRHRFSKNDVQSVHDLGVDSYMVDSTGAVRKLSKDHNEPARRAGHGGDELEARVRVRREDPIVVPPTKLAAATGGGSRGR